jgi:hypothetical protein
MLDQLVRGDREVANARAGGMEYCIRDGRAGPGDPNFPDAARAKRIQLGIGNVDRRDIDFAKIRVHRYVIVGQIGVHNAPVSLR